MGYHFARTIEGGYDFPMMGYDFARPGGGGVYDFPIYNVYDVTMGYDFAWRTSCERN